MIPEEQLKEWEKYYVKYMEYITPEGSQCSMQLTQIEPLKQLIAEVRRLQDKSSIIIRCKQLLKEIEWEGGLGPNEDDKCPMCKNENTRGHDINCELKLLLEER